MRTIEKYLTSRTAKKLGRDILVIGIPALLVWVIGHPVELGRFGLAPEDVVQVTGWAATLLAGYRIIRAYFVGEAA